MKYSKQLVDMGRRPKCKCGKVSFDKRGAETKRNALLKAGRERYLRIYPCPYSNTWHLTSEIRNKELYEDIN